MACSWRPSSRSSARRARCSPRGPRRAILRAGRIAAILDDPTRLDRYVATAQLGITFASLGLGMYGEHTLAGFIERGLLALGLPGLGALITAHGLAVVLAILVITYLHIVLGEMVPKALALGYAVPVALWVTPPMLAIGLVLYPLVVGLNRTGTFLLHLAGVERGRSAEHYLGADELESLARESRAGGMLSEESGRIFQELADFGELTAAQAMVPRVHTRGIPADASDEALREILQQHRHTRYPVYVGDLDRIVGTVHIKDLLAALQEGRGLWSGDGARDGLCAGDGDVGRRAGGDGAHAQPDGRGDG